MLTESLLKLWSLGIVTKDILEDDLYVDIAPIEIHASIDGELSATTDIKHKATTSDGVISNINVTQSDIIKAKWLPYGDTNRLEPPTVCKGERVRIYKYADTDQYYWNTLYNELELRKLEKRTIVVSNKASIDVPPDQLLENSYYYIIDTINKLVKLRTSDTDGEYTTYEITIDTKEGKLEILDGKGNSIFLDSQIDTLITSTNLSIINNTIEKIDNILDHYQINVNTYHVYNGQDELIQTLMDFVQTCHDALGVGNLQADVPMSSSTKDAFDGIKARLAGFR